MDPKPESPPPLAVPEVMSLPARLFNVYAAPGEVFESVRSSPPSRANWLVPTILSALMGIVFSLVVLGQPDIANSAFAAQEKALQERVDSGKLTQKQADQQITAMKSIAPFMKYFGMAGAVFGTVVFLFVISGLVWILSAKILKGDVAFMKALEVVGLAGMIHVVGGLIAMLVVLSKGDITAGANLALLVGTFDPRNALHQVLAVITIPTLWYNAVLSIGVSKLSGAPFLKTAAWVFGFWFVVRGASAAGSFVVAKVTSGL